MPLRGDPRCIAFPRNTVYKHNSISIFKFKSEPHLVAAFPSSSTSRQRRRQGRREPRGLVQLPRLPAASALAALVLLLLLLPGVGGHQVLRHGGAGLLLGHLNGKMKLYQDM